MNNDFVKIKNKSLINLKPHKEVIKKRKKQDDLKKFSVNPEINYNNYNILQRYSDKIKSKKSNVAKEDIPNLNNFFKFNDFNSKLVNELKKDIHVPKSNNNRYNLFKSNNQVFYIKSDNARKKNKEKYIIKRSKSNNKEKLKQCNNLSNNKILIKGFKAQISKNQRKPPLINIDLTQDEKNEKEPKNKIDKKNSLEISKNKNKNRNSLSPMKKIPSININLSEKENQNKIKNKREDLKESDNNNNKIQASINH